MNNSVGIKNAVKPELYVAYKGKAGIYSIRNEVNFKVYVGSTQDLYNRLVDHFRELRTNTHCNEHLQNAYNYYGHDNFTYCIEHDYNEVDDAKLRWMEDLMIEDYRSHDREYGYNIIREGYKARVHSDETKQKISKKHSKALVSYEVETGKIENHESRKQVCSVNNYNPNSLHSAIKKRAKYENRYWFYETDLDILNLKMTFIRNQNLKKPGPKSSVIILDQETGIFYNSIAELAQSIGENRVTVGFRLKRYNFYGDRYKVIGE